MSKPFILPKDIPLEEYPKPEVFLEEGRRIADEARKQGLVMRVMGPLALHYYFPEQVDLYARLERLGDRYFTDIDFAAYGKQRKQMMDFMKRMGYEVDLQTIMVSGKTRHIYYAGAVPMIDVFFDSLNYCHEVKYDGRLEYDDYCVSLADILLQKLQIWEINDKDLKDIEYLFITAQVGDDDAKKINQSYVARRFADDWGFWYTATTNLDRVKAHVDDVAALGDEQKSRVKQVADQFRARIDAEPKTKGWEKRAKKGTDKIWYNQGFSDW
jgi:hypothetical protein